MILVYLTFGVSFLLVAATGLMLYERPAMEERIAEAINPRPRRRTLVNVIRDTGFSVGDVVERFEHLLPKSKQEVSVVKERLYRAGYRSDSTISMFYGWKVATPVLLAVLVTVTGVARLSPFFVYATALGLGFLAPDFWLGQKISARQKKITRGLPDILDMLVICIEAGQSLDQATSRTAREMRRAQPELSDELGIVVLEQHAGRPRSEAWKRMAERTGIDTIRNLVSMLVQAEQFGTSVGRTLRVQAETLRNQSVKKLEEKAAKTSVKLVFPLVLFIFPALFLVTMGPAVIMMAERFQTFFIH